MTVDRKDGGPPKVGDKSPKVGGPFQIDHSSFVIDFDSSFEKGHSSFEKGHIGFEIGHRKFCLFVKFQKPPKVGGLTMTEGVRMTDRDGGS